MPGAQAPGHGGQRRPSVPSEGRHGQKRSVCSGPRVTGTQTSPSNLFNWWPAGVVLGLCKFASYMFKCFQNLMVKN